MTSIYYVLVKNIHNVIIKFVTKTFVALVYGTQSRPIHNIKTNEENKKKQGKISHVCRAGLIINSLQLTFLPSSKSHDTKTRTNIRNPAPSSLDIVP